MDELTAWDVVVTALRQHFIKGNSQIHNVDEWIEEQTIETLQKIRNTRGNATETLVKFVKLVERVEK